MISQLTIRPQCILTPCLRTSVQIPFLQEPFQPDWELVERQTLSLSSTHHRTLQRGDGWMDGWMNGWMDGCPYGGCCGINPTPQELAQPLTVNIELGLLYQVPCLHRELAAVTESGILNLKCVCQTILRHCDFILFIPLQLLPIELPCKIRYFLGEADLKYCCLALCHLHRLHLSQELQWLICSKK